MIRKAKAIRYRKLRRDASIASIIRSYSNKRLMGKKYSLHLRKEDVEMLVLVARHRMMSPQMLAQELLTLGILSECGRLKSIFGEEWRKKMKDVKKGMTRG